MHQQTLARSKTGLSDTNEANKMEIFELVCRYEGGFQRDWHEALDYYKEVDPVDVGVG